MKSVYFDNAATTQIREEVLDRMIEVLKEIPGNPSSTHAVGRSAKSLIENARKAIAKILNVTPGEIIFTSGGTEADNLAIKCAVRDLKVKRIITSRIEHHAVLHAAEEIANEHKIALEFVPLKECGTPDEIALEGMLKGSSQKTLVSLMHINNEIGNKIDIKAIATLCKSHNALVHCDMVQSVGHYSLDLQEIPVDFIAAAAHKFHGPKGVGFAFVRKNSGLKPLISGGSQERGLRAGTEAVHNIVGMHAAMEYAYDNLEQESNYVKSLKEYFITKITEEIPEAKLNGNCNHLEKSTYTLVNVCLPMAAEKALLLLFQLDMKGIACSKGSACQSGSDKGSHVLTQVLSPEDLKKPSVRFSFSKYNTKDEIDYVIDILKEYTAVSVTE